MEQIADKVQEWIALYGLKVIAAIVILIIGRWAAKGVTSLIRKMLRKGRIDETLVSFVANLCYVGIMAFVIIAALGQLGVHTASFVAVLGAAGLAVGLALQGSLSNFAAGVLMIIFKPFKVGDYIEGAGVAGAVEEIGIFTTELKSPDNKKIIVPNAKMTSDNIVNYSAKEIRRVDLVAGVSYGDDLDTVRKVLEGILAGDERVLNDSRSDNRRALVGRQQRQFRRAALGQNRRLLGCLFRDPGEHQEAIRRRGHQHPVPAAGYSCAQG